MTAQRGSTSRSGPGYCPINLSLAGKYTLLLGGGPLANQIAARFVDFGAFVVVVAPYVVPEIQEMAITLGPKITIQKRAFGDEDEAKVRAREFVIVVGCSDSDDDNLRLLEISRQASVPVYLPDSPEQSDFILPVVVKRGHVKIGIATDGLSRQVEEALGLRIKASLGSQLDKYVLFLNSFREKLVELEADPQLGNPAALRKIARRLAEAEELLLAIQRENFEEAQQLVEQVILEEQEACAR